MSETETTIDVDSAVLAVIAYRSGTLPADRVAQRIVEVADVIVRARSMPAPQATMAAVVTIVHDVVGALGLDERAEEPIYDQLCQEVLPYLPARYQPSRDALRPD